MLYLLVALTFSILAVWSIELDQYRIGLLCVMCSGVLPLLVQSTYDKIEEVEVIPLHQSSIILDRMNNDLASMLITLNRMEDQVKQLNEDLMCLPQD